MSFNLITILGPTATGKTKLAVQLADYFNGEIISADSRQVYRNMNIGTGKDLNEYKINNTEIKYHLIDVIDPSDEFNLFLFKQLFNEAYLEIKNRKKLPFLVGGTGLYLSSVLQNYKLKESFFDPFEYKKLEGLSLEELQNILLSLTPLVHNKTDLEEKERLIKAILIHKSGGKEIRNIENINSLNIGINPPKNELKKRIKERLKKRLNEGMADEVRDLLKTGITHKKLVFFGLEYKFISLYLDGKLNYNDMFQKLNSAINDFAKRQMTWFRKMEREGVEITWIENPDYQKAKDVIENHLKNIIE